MLPIRTARCPDLDYMNVPREIDADAAKRLATEKHTPMMHGCVLE
jgi:hypothetical protein